MVLIVAITGATGVIYGIRLLEYLAKVKGVETHLIISEAGETTIKLETAWSIEKVKQLANFNYDIKDVAARISSGSFKRDGMIIAPCTVKTMSAIANSYNENLIIRAADVTLKERRKLIMMVRETPLHLGHLRTMERLCEMGAIIMPPVPAFYHKPETIEDLVSYTVGKTLDMFDIDHGLFQRWPGCTSDGEIIIE
jgi:4-hydroxy-3-polyprenylbenzoate decarboxylase